MHPDDALWMGRCGGDRRDEQRRRVGRKHTVGGDDARQLAQQALLELECLGRRLDHQLGWLEVRELSGVLEALARRLARGRRQTPTVNVAHQLGANLLRSAGERVGRGVVEQRPRAGERRELGDAGAHRAGAQHADRLGWWDRLHPWSETVAQGDAAGLCSRV